MNRSRLQTSQGAGASAHPTTNGAAGRLAGGHSGWPRQPCARRRLHGRPSNPPVRRWRERGNRTLSAAPATRLRPRVACIADHGCEQQDDRRAGPKGWGASPIGRTLASCSPKNSVRPSRLQHAPTKAAVSELRTTIRLLGPMCVSRPQGNEAILKGPVPSDAHAHKPVLRGSSPVQPTR